LEGSFPLARKDDVTPAPRRSPHEGKPRLRILIACDTFPPDVNGSATFVSNLVAGLMDRGHEVHAAAPAVTNKRVGKFIEHHHGHDMIVHRIYSWRWYPQPWLRFAIPWRIKQNARRIVDAVKPDVIHFQSHIITGRGFSIAAVERGIELVGTNHFMPENLLEYTLLPKFFQRKAIRMAWDAAGRSYGRANAVTSPTRRAADLLEENTGVRPVYAISNAVNMHEYTRDMSPKSENLIVFVGRVVHEKQIDKLLRAFAKLDPALDAKLEIVGFGDQENELKNLAKTLGIADSVKFTGFASEDDKKDALHRAKVFAMPSIAELQSISTMEAMASGLPVVAANAVALPHLVHDGENGYLFEPGNVDELAARLGDVLSLPHDELLKMKQASLDIVSAHGIERTLDIFECLYRGESVDAMLAESQGSASA
jgi:glycosyltransferase involved in cell wall biosynthesis